MGAGIGHVPRYQQQLATPQVRNCDLRVSLARSSAESALHQLVDIYSLVEADMAERQPVLG